MPADVRVTGVEGLRQFARDLKAIEPALAKDLQKLNKSAAESVSSKARASYEAQHQRRSGRGAASIRPLATQTKAQVALGSARAPYMLGQEFGSHQGPHRGQFPPYNSGEGNFFYPAVRAEAAQLPERYAELLDGLLRPVFPD